MTTGRINQVAKYRGRGKPLATPDGSELIKAHRSGRTSRQRAPSQRALESAGGLACDVRGARVRTGDPNTSRLPSWDGRRPRSRSPWPSRFLPLSARKLPRNQRIERARSQYFRGRRSMASTGRSGNERLSAGCTFICVTTAKGARVFTRIRRHEADYPVPSWTTTRSVRLLEAISHRWCLGLHIVNRYKLPFSSR